MIHVDTRRLPYNLPMGWLRKAAQAQRELDAAATADEAAAILRNRRYWRELIEELRRESCGKCWYTESLNAASRMDVDHFRPKGPVRDVDGSRCPGYPFLAFDLANYRLSAQLPNQATATDAGTRGKHQQFPLEDPSRRANDKAGIQAETPLLLDPTKPGDPRLLTFNEEGQPRAAVSQPADPLGFRRATTTIEVLWLDRTELSDERKAEWTKAHQRIELADRLMRRARTLSAEGRTAEAGELWDATRTLLCQLRDAAQPTARYGAAMQACLLASGRAWAFRMASRASRRSLILYASLMS